ncbi:MAG: Hydroxyacylglutathione hydrolase [Syntrophus sp. SKADARSKE-3]|nr:Hydroxyacylglutathione hydrolase [Syntrophus sp. SKADARSKE-3]
MKQLSQGKINDYIYVAGNASYPGYVIKGKDKNLMIDAGMNLMGPLYVEDVGKILGNPDNLDYLFVTHSHYDHLGAVPYIKRRIPELCIGAHKRVSELMSKEGVRAVMNRLSDVQRGFFRDIIGDEDVTIGPVETGIYLKEDDEISLGGLTCRVYEVPGHTKDSLAFFIPEIKTLFTGEAAGVPEDRDGNGIQVCFLTSYDDYLSSLEKIISICPETLCLGHGWVLSHKDASSFIKASLDATPTYRRLIEGYLDAAHGDIDQAIQTMGKKEYDERGVIIHEKTAYMTNLSAQVRHIAGLNGQK